LLLAGIAHAGFPERLTAGGFATMTPFATIGQQNKPHQDLQPISCRKATAISGGGADHL